MDLSEEDVAQILRLVDEARFGELEIEWKGLTLRLVKGTSDGGRSVRRSHTGPAPVEVPSPAAVGRAPAAEDVVASPGASEPGFVGVTAPVMGTFYRRPEPGAAPFVEVGVRVERGDTLCLLEVMKVYTAVKAEIAGRIEKILAEDAQLVDFGQTLFLIKAD